MATAYRLEDLEAWKLSACLRDRIHDWLKTSSLSRTDDFREQLHRSSSSAPANLAEGFGHFKPRQFGKYTRIARASLFETRDHLMAASRNGHVPPDLTDSLLRLNARAIGATTRLLAYLDSCPAEGPTGWAHGTSPKRRNRRQQGAEP
jgi:four helix bundle protein